MIIGETDNVFLIQAYLDDAISVEDELAAVLTHITADDELVIFTDLLGGSVNNIMIREALKDNVHIVSGFNLPLLIEVIMGDANTPATCKPDCTQAGIRSRNDLIAVEPSSKATKIIIPMSAGFNKPDRICNRCTPL